MKRENWIDAILVFALSLAYLSLLPHCFSVFDEGILAETAERIYLGGVQFSASDDGGRTWWEGNATENIHSDHHALYRTMCQHAQKLYMALQKDYCDQTSPCLDLPDYAIQTNLGIRHHHCPASGPPETGFEQTEKHAMYKMSYL